MRFFKEKGVNLTELVAVLVVAGIAIPVLLTMWANISWRSIGSEGVADASFYAQELLEEIKAKKYDERSASPWTSPPNLGPDPGENLNNASTFNDADDFINATDPRITAPSQGYVRSASIQYALLNSTGAWEACPAFASCVAPSACSNCNECCYKMITVKVSRGNEVIGNITMSAIMSGN